MKLYNTLTRTTEDVRPLHDNLIRLYTCGLTVYSQPHIGNWVAYIYWDILVRVLADAGFDVKRVQNITDVGHLTSDEDSGEDKMEKGARAENVTAWDIADKYIAVANHEAFDLLGLLRPDEMPRATQYIPQQIAFVQELERKGFTYEIPGDGIYFDTGKLEDYGKLARLDIAGLQAGARVADSGKKNPTDFALWKCSPTDTTRDMEWDSPWGRGFPGWHLECSVMAQELLGNQIDIHTGGIDHIPVHHTNEIAQTEAVTGTQFSTYWLHNNHLKVDGEKMSKSLGNIYTLHDITERGYSVDAFKLLILSKHYRTEGNFTWDILGAAQSRLQHLQAVADLRWQATAADGPSIDYEVVLEQIRSHLRNDLNTPMALAVLSTEFVDKIGSSGLLSEQSRVAFVTFLQAIDELFGLRLLQSNDITDAQKRILHDRQAARDNKDWATSDTLRDLLAEQGIAINDTAHGQIWSRL